MKSVYVIFTGIIFRISFGASSFRNPGNVAAAFESARNHFVSRDVVARGFVNCRQMILFEIYCFDSQTEIKRRNAAFVEKIKKRVVSQKHKKTGNADNRNRAVVNPVNFRIFRV